MKTVYIDNEFKCHTTNPDNIFRAIETRVFDGICDEVIEGHRLIPFEETYIREDGIKFHGEMKFPWKNSEELDEVQRSYEKKLLAELRENSIPAADLEAAYQEGVNTAYDQ